MDLQYGSIEITTKIGCPVACSYCPQDKTTGAYKGERMMSMETMLKCLDKIPIYTNVLGHVVPRLEFSGFCEPFANPNCAELVLAGYNKGFTNITLYTTLRGAKMEDLEKIKHIPWAFFSLHLPDKEGMIQVKVDEEYLKMFRFCMDNMKDVCFFAYGTIKDEVWDIIKDYDTNKIYWNMIIHSRAGNVDGVQPVERKSGHIRCMSSQGMALNHNILLPNGDVSVCCMDFGLKNIVGNLLTDSYDSLFRSEGHNKVVAGMYVDSMDSMCRICDYAVPNESN
jgi:organic radical activating enzyme